MSKDYKNTVLHRHYPDPKEERANLTKEALLNSTPFPEPVEYEDIDKAFKEWTNTVLDVSIEGEKVPTITLMSNERFSEYIQTWDKVDNNRNLFLNFKTITRDTNPKKGEIFGKVGNIPVMQDLLLKMVETQDDAGRTYFVKYKMKQPFAIDLKYKIGFVTNKYEHLNTFNTLVNKQFQSLYSYIYVNGHYFPIKLDDISEENESNVDNRQFFNQTYSFTVMSYIINRDDFSVEECPKLKLVNVSYDLSSPKSYADIEELPIDPEKMVIPIKIDVTIASNIDNYKFHPDCNFKLTGVTTDNISSMKVKINGDIVDFIIIDDVCYTKVTYDKFGILENKSFEKIDIHDGDAIKIYDVKKQSDKIISTLEFNGNKKINT